MLIIYILAECPGSLLLMNRDKHQFIFSSSSKMQTLFQHYSLQPKPELPLDRF